MTLGGTLGLCLLFSKGLWAHHYNIPKIFHEVASFHSCTVLRSDPPACRPTPVQTHTYCIDIVLFFYCCDKSPWSRQLIKGRDYSGLQRDESSSPPWQESMVASRQGSSWGSRQGSSRGSRRSGQQPGQQAGRAAAGAAGWALTSETSSRKHRARQPGICGFWTLKVYP